MLQIREFQNSDFEEFITWIDTKELLITIAGAAFSFPVTEEQLEKYLAIENSLAFTILESKKLVGHAELILRTPELVKIDKLVIGDKTQRGKGTGTKIIYLLCEYAFQILHAKIVELNVYDWNISGIRCYEKSGFKYYPENDFWDETGDIRWKALNMRISLEEWENKMNGLQKDQSI